MRKTATIILFLSFLPVLIIAKSNLFQQIKPFVDRLEDQRAKAITLEEFAPSKFPGFSDLRKANQIIEQIDFFKRKFKLSLNEFNIITDEIFPLLEHYSENNRSETDNILKELNNFEKRGKYSLFHIQKNLNYLLLRISRLEKELDMLRLNNRQKELTKEDLKKSSGSDTTLPIPVRISLFKEEKKELEKEHGFQVKKLTELKFKESEKKKKIEEKILEVKKLKTERKNSSLVKGKINEILSSSINLRVNGLEIPLLNTTKTLIYMTNTKISTLKEKIDLLDQDIEILKKRRVSDIRTGIVKAIIVLFFAIIAVLLLIRLAGIVSRKTLKRIESSKKIGPHKKQRYETLSSVILSFVKIVLWTSAAIWVMGILNINYGPFLMAAGGISLAIGFGAQSLVKDLVTGFFLLMEEQFALGDVVEINGKTGTIEKISLRTVKFRSLDGTLHTIPNGNISTVSNSTYQWSRAVVNIGVSYNDNHEKVISVLQNICDKIYDDPDWKGKFIEKPSPQGILSFGDSAVNYRIIAKTESGQQWGIGRELNIRIKNEFDKNGIEIPYNYLNVINSHE